MRKKKNKPNVCPECGDDLTSITESRMSKRVSLLICNNCDYEFVVKTYKTLEEPGFESGW